MNCDVLVIGGGSAGLAAATTAARTGAQTILVERHGMLGGMGTASLVHTFCGLYHLDTDQPEIANPGWCEEIADRMTLATGLGPKKLGRVWILPQHPVEFASIADQLVKSSGVTTHFHSEVTRLTHTPDHHWAAEVCCRGEILTITSTSLIDASGDAIAAAALNTPNQSSPPDHLQRPAYVCAFGGVETETIDPLTLAGRLVEGIRSGDLPAASLGMHFRASSRPGEIFGTLDLSGEESGHYNPTDPDCLASIEMTGRQTCHAILSYLRTHHPGWERAFIAAWPARAGVRESRRWTGRAQLTGDHILHSQRFDDEIALATWPMEMRENNRGPKLRYPLTGQPAGIPADALRARNFDNLFVAGRCISCDHDAQASIRVMGTCFATGEAAGRMATTAATQKSSCPSPPSRPS